MEGIEAYFAKLLEDQKMYENEPLANFIAKTGLHTFVRTVKENAD